jgi:NADH-quinone oxidoreductase subunit L
MMQLAVVTLAATDGSAGDVAHGAGWILEHAWILPLIPFISFLAILAFGRRLRYKGAELGIAALALCFVLALGAAGQWIGYTNDATSSGHGATSEHAAAVAGTGESAAGPHVAADTPSSDDHGAATTSGEEGASGEAEHAVAPVERTWTWWESGGMDFEVGILVDGLSVMMLIVVSIVSLLVHIYSTDYVHGDIRYTHYFAFLSLFTASMLMLVISASTVQFITSWELVGVCSFVLIGHWWEEKKNSDAALKAFLTNRVGDIGLIIGMSILFFTAGGAKTFNIRETATAAASGSVSHTALLVASLCLLAAVMSKSGQFFLHTWLPDAMAGPTPVSALIHAATMVVAGVFMVARLYPVFFEGLSISGNSFNLLALVGALTTLVGGSLAFVQTDIKKVLAYSTVSQLGYMVLALGVGAWTAGVFHLFTHAFFKACLFLGAGSVSHACHHSFDMKADMGGLRKYMPRTFATFLIGSAALAGIPLFSGFWSKDEILAGTGGLGLSSGANGTYHLMLLMGLLTAGMTAAYMTRVVYLTFFGEYRGGRAVAAHSAAAHDTHAPAGHAVAAAHDAHGHDAHGHDAHGHDAHGHDAHGEDAHGGLPHESGPRITIPLIVLAALSFITVFANIPDRFSFIPSGWRLRFEHYVEPKGAYFAQGIKHAAFSPALALISIVVAATGIGVTYWYYFVKVNRLDPYATELPDGLTTRNALARRGYQVLENKYYLDWLYTDVIVAFVKGPLARAANRFNQQVLDGVVNGSAEVTKKAGYYLYTYFDQKVVDGVVNGSGAGASETGGLLRRIQTGRISQYAALLFGAAAILAGVLVFAI